MRLDAEAIRRGQVSSVLRRFRGLAGENLFSPSVTKVAEASRRRHRVLLQRKAGRGWQLNAKELLAKEPVAAPPAKPAPVPSPLSVGETSPRKPLLGTTAVPTTEEELLALMKKQTGMTSEYESFAWMLKAQNWVAVLGTLRTLESGPLANVEIVSSVIQDVLGPICEAQGIAKAVIVIASKVIGMYLNAKQIVPSAKNWVCSSEIWDRPWITWPNRCRIKQVNCWVLG